MDRSNEIINSVVAKMTDKLNDDQLTILEATLIVSLHGMKVEQEETSIIPATKDWDYFLKRFRATKRLKNCAESTLKQYDFTLAHFRDFIQKNPLDITKDDIKYYLMVCAETPAKITGKIPSKRYLNGKRRNLSAFFSWMHEEGYIVMNPVHSVPAIKEPRVIRNAYSGADMEKMRFGTTNLRDRALEYLLDSTGCRIGEILALDRDDINFNTLSIRVYGQKGKAERVVFFTEETAYHLQLYFDSREDDNPALFVGRRKPYKRLTKAGAEVAIRKIGEKVGVHAHPHKYRRTMITRCVRRGMPLQEIQTIAGHVKPETTQIYIDAEKMSLQQSYLRCS